MASVVQPQVKQAVKFVPEPSIVNKPTVNTKLADPLQETQNINSLWNNCIIWKT